MAKTKADRILALESMYEACVDGARLSGEYHAKKDAETGERIKRLRAYAATITSLVYMAAGPEREATTHELIQIAQERCLFPGDLGAPESSESV